MKLPNVVFPTGRKLIFSFLVLGLIISFFFSYHYYYIPSNRANVDKYGFLILENIKSGVQDKNNNLKRVYTTFLTDKGTSSLQDKLKARSVEGKVIIRSQAPIIDSTVQLVNLNKNELLYSIGKDSKSTLISVPLKNKFTSFFDRRRDELFKSYMLLSINDSNAVSVYLDEGLPFGENINTDSLLPDKKGLFISGVRDINVANIDYKMFYYPFAMDNQQMMLCGFVNNSEYRSKLQEIPASFIYAFVTIFLLLFITLPVLKFFIMGPEEEIKFRDLLFFVLSLFIGSTLLTLAIIQIILLKDGDIRAEGNLVSLEKQISKNFTGEIGKAYRQLNILDTLVASPLQGDTAKDVSHVIQKYLTDHQDDSTVYRDFDRIAWTDSTGQQFRKGDFNSSPLYPMIKERKYFKDFENNTPLQMPGAPGHSFAMEPLYNWVNGDFRTVISKSSVVKKAFIVSLSAGMRSVTNTILPAGFGFCIIDRNGRVQFHSDSTKNLHENFIDQLSSAKQVKEAIASRQEVFLNSSGFYGKKYCLYISPVAQLPYYTITFYDRRYIVPINMRILVFALLLSIISCCMYTLLWYFVLWRGYYKRSLLLSPVSYVNWIIPKARYLNMYQQLSIFLAIYIGIMLLLTFVLKFADIRNNYLLLVIMLITPLNIAAGFLFIMRRNKNLKATGEQTQSMLQQKSFRYYNYFVVLLIILTAVLPSSLFTWYSHNQEILQSVKKQQLFLAEKINERAASIKKEEISNRNYDRTYYEDVYLEKGIYTIYADKLDFADSLGAGDPQRSFNDFYFTVSNAAGTGYFDPLFFPALKDNAADKKWQWNYRQAESLLQFSYHFQAGLVGYTADSLQANYLQIRSTLPKRYVVLSDPAKLTVLIILVLFIFFGIYSIIQHITKNIFLRKYAGLTTTSEGIKVLIDKYIKAPGNEPMVEEYLLPAVDTDPASRIPTSDIAIKEEQMMNRVSNYKKLYEFIWRDCSAKEKHMLYDFASDGLMNFKNTPEIFALAKKGIIYAREDGEFAFFDPGFRIYLTKFLPASQITALR
ncbi:MAG TPA: hypothetical protein VFV68_09385, partial [Agriterribacter sp.]|nr:hypothetical protein [Agriterribacter sp.]